MTLRWYYAADAVTVLEITDRVDWPQIEIGGKANQDGWEGDLIVDDPNGDFLPLMYRRIYAVQDSAPSGDQVVGNWFVSNLKVHREGNPPVLASRTWIITMADENSLFDRRLFVGTDSNRPAETDIERLRWALTTTEMNVFSPDETWIDTSGPVNLDANDFRQQGVRDLMNSLMAASLKHYWAKYENAALVGGAIVSSSVAASTVITTTTPHGLYTGMQVVIAGHSGSTPSLNGLHTITVTGPTTFTIPVTVTVGGTGGTTSTVGRYVVWYANMNTSSLYASTLSLSNIESEVGDPESTLVYALSKSAELDRAGGRMASGLVAPFKAGWVYVQDPTVGDAYAYVDRVAPAPNVTTLAKATAQVTAQLPELSIPDDQISTVWTVEEANLNLIRQGMIVPVHASHFPNYTEDTALPGYADGFVQCRVQERTVRQPGPSTFEVPMLLSPMRVSGHFLIAFLTGSDNGVDAPTDLSTNPWTMGFWSHDFCYPQTVFGGAGPPVLQAWGVAYREVVAGESATVGEWTGPTSGFASSFVMEVAGVDPSAIMSAIQVISTRAVHLADAGTSTLSTTALISSVLIGGTAFAKVAYDGGWCASSRPDAWGPGGTPGALVTASHGTEILNNNPAQDCGEATTPWLWIGHDEGTGALSCAAIANSHGDGVSAYIGGYNTSKCGLLIPLLGTFGIVQSAHNGQTGGSYMVTLPNPPTPT